jgi:hypothetical protein
VIVPLPGTLTFTVNAVPVTVRRVSVTFSFDADVSRPIAPGSSGPVKVMLPTPGAGGFGADGP